MNRAFTFAELLITLAVVGIVAALTLPTLITNINNNINNHKINVTKTKIRQGTDLLNIENGIGPYYSSSLEFFTALSKHLKISKICDNSHLSECIPYKNILSSDGNYITEVKVFKTATNLGIYKKNYGEIVGIILADGTPILATYNKECKALDPDTPNQNTTSCISAIFDINGNKGPNQRGKDIIGFNTGYGRAFQPQGISANECKELQQKGYGIKTCFIDGDRWANGVKECGGTKNIPTMEDLDYLEEIYQDPELQTAFLKETGLPSGFALWANEECGDTRYYVCNKKFGYYPLYIDGTKGNQNYYMLCTGN